MNTPLCLHYMYIAYLVLEALQLSSTVAFPSKHHTRLFPGLVEQVAVPTDSSLPDNYN